MDARILMPACAAMLMMLGAQAHAETVVPAQGQTPGQIQADTAACQAQQRRAQQQSAKRVTRSLPDPA